MKKIIFLLPILFLMVACTKPTPSVPTNPGSATSGEVVELKNSPITHTTYGSGKHVMQIYADYQCPACISLAQSIVPIFEEFATQGKVQLQFKQYPLVQIHKNAYNDALASLCADELGKYGDYKNGLYALERKKAGATVTDDERIDLATSVGISDIDTFRSCLTSKKYKSKVDKDIADGDALGIGGTPTIYFDGKKLDHGSIFADIEKGKAFLERILAE